MKEANGECSGDDCKEKGTQEEGQDVINKNR